jgi:hypothetical protein
MGDLYIFSFGGNKHTRFEKKLTWKPFLTINWSGKKHKKRQKKKRDKMLKKKHKKKCNKMHKKGAKRLT